MRSEPTRDWGSSNLDRISYGAVEGETTKWQFAHPRSARATAGPFPNKTGDDRRRAYHREPMFRVNVRNYAESGSERATAAWQSINSQPSWLARAVVWAFLIVVALPLLLLMIIALLVATIVFGVLWLVNKVLLLLRPVLPRRDGRENVRVIRRVDGP